jgi:MFS family permease
MLAVGCRSGGQGSPARLVAEAVLRGMRHIRSALGPAGYRSRYGAALALALGPAIALGLARFGYSLLLAPMRVSLHWSFTMAGALSTANSAGYLAGAVLAGPLTRWWGTRKAFVLATCLSAMSLLATAATSDSLTSFGLRAAAGVTGAVTFIAGAALVAQVSPPGSGRRSATLLSVSRDRLGGGPDPAPHRCQPGCSDVGPSRAGKAGS